MCSQQRSEREQINVSPEALSSAVPGEHQSHGASPGAPGLKAWELLLGRVSQAQICQPPGVCVLFPLGRTSLKSFLKEHLRISKINVQGASLSWFWVKQNEVEKSPRFTWVCLSKLIKQ